MYNQPHSQGILYMPGVLSPRSSFTGWRKLEIFLGGKPTLLMLCLATILLRRVYVVWTYGRRTTEVGLSLGLEVLTLGLRLYLLMIVPIFFESGLKELQLTMEALLVTQSPGHVHQGCKNGLFIGRVVM
jgi:hypothetical protein